MAQCLGYFLLRRKGDLHFEVLVVFDHRREVQVQLFRNWELVKILINKASGKLDFPFTSYIIENNMIVVLESPLGEAIFSCCDYWLKPLVFFSIGIRLYDGLG